MVAPLALLLSACAAPMLPDERTSYAAEHGWAKLDRPWGSTSALDVDREGNVWVFERCGENTCAGSTLAPVLEFDSSGRLLRSFGAGLFVFPHAIHVDREGNIFVADADGKNGKGQVVASGGYIALIEAQGQGSTLNVIRRKIAVVR